MSDMESSISLSARRILPSFLARQVSFPNVGTSQIYNVPFDSACISQLPCPPPSIKKVCVEVTSRKLLDDSGWRPSFGQGTAWQEEEIFRVLFFCFCVSIDLLVDF